MIRVPEVSEIDQHLLRRRMTAASLGLLAASVLCVILAPTLMPESYSIVEHSISESAAQRVEGVWLARAGLLLFGLAVLGLASSVGSRWGLWGRVAHRAYGVSIISSAVFAHMPWEDVPYDEFEDLLHSIASFAVGMSFVGGVVLVGLRRRRSPSWVRALDGIAVIASVVIPVIMFSVAGYAGLVQRMMFVVAYVWYGVEASGSAWPKARVVEGESNQTSTGWLHDGLPPAEHPPL